MNQKLERSVIRHHQNMIAASGVLTGDGNRLRQAGGTDDVDGEFIGANISDRRRQQRGWIIHAHIQRVSVLQRNDNVLADLPRRQRHVDRVAILPETGIDEALAVGSGRRNGAGEIHAGFQIREGEGAIGGRELGLAEALSGDGDGGLDGVVGFVADEAGEGGGGGGGGRAWERRLGEKRKLGTGCNCDFCAE